MTYVKLDTDEAPINALCRSSAPESTEGSGQGWRLAKDGDQRFYRLNRLRYGVRGALSSRLVFLTASSVPSLYPSA